jgi:predicted acyl esterase
MPPTWAAGTSIVEHVWAYSVRSHGRQTVHHRVDVIGPIELQLDAACTAPDTAFIAFLQDVSDDGNVTNITAGYLRAGLRKVDEEQSKQAAPVRSSTDRLEYHIPYSISAQCATIQAGHKMRLYLTTDDHNKDVPAPLEFRHASVGTSSFNMVFSSSRLSLPVAK